MKIRRYINNSEFIGELPEREIHNVATRSVLLNAQKRGSAWTKK